MKKRFTYEQHKEIGSELKNMRVELMEMSASIYNHFPTNNDNDSKVMYRELEKALACIDKAKHHGDELLYKDFPELDRITKLTTYYD
jgi:hypothetical protein